MPRARLEWHRGTGIYSVIDTWSNCLVLQTTSYRVADYWRDRVNACCHPIHYDPTDHDRRVLEWEEQREQGRVE